MTYYDLLDISPSASEEEIRRAYRELVEIHHPDRMQELRADVQARAELRLKQINQAYAVLRDPEERARYDAALAQQPTGETLPFVPRGSAGVARSNLRERIAEVERQMGEAHQQIERLVPRTEGRRALDEQWERYLLASLGLAWPFIFLGAWAATPLAIEPLSALTLRAVGALFIFGYLCLLIVVWVSRAPVRERELARLLVSVPLAVILFVVTVLIGAPRSMHLVALIAGYAAIVWQGVGSPLAERRNHALIATHKIKELEEELRVLHTEKQHLQSELARH